MSLAMIAESKKLLSILDEQLLLLKKAHEHRVAEAVEAPSRRQEFFYVADSNGVISIQPDADFVMEQMFLTYKTTNDAGYGSAMVRIAIEDSGASRRWTVAQVPQAYVAAPSALVETPLVTVQGLQVLWQAFKPNLATEVLIPRGSVITARYEFSSGTKFNGGSFILCGYKVF